MKIDCHQHVNWQGIDAQKLLAHLDSLSVDKAWLHSWEAIDGGLEWNYIHISISDLIKTCEAYPERFIPFAAPDPRRPEVVSRLEKLVKKGVKGYGELKVHTTYDSPDCVRIFRRCGELGLPVLFHLQYLIEDFQPEVWYGGHIDNVERALKLCPETNFIGHGPGWWAEISDDGQALTSHYPTGPIIPGHIIRLLRSYPNIYADISAGSGLNALKRDRHFGREFLINHAEKVLYGTDWIDDGHMKFLEELTLPEKVANKIFFENALRLVPA